MLTAWGRRGGESVQRRAGGERCDVRIGVEAVNLLRGGFQISRNDRILANGGRAGVPSDGSQDFMML